jgi:hypothetical protein
MLLRNYFASRARFLSTPKKLCSGILISYHAIGIAPQACTCGHKTQRISSQSVSPTIKRCEYTLHKGEISSGREDVAGNHLNERQENSAKEKAESSHENHKRTNIRKGRELEAERNNLAAGGAHGATSRAAEKSAGNVLPRKHAAL